MAVGKIICIGDSLTAGSEADPNGYRSYRGALQLLLQNAGYTVDFVGTRSSTPATGGTDPEHDGYGGARMDSSDDATNSIEGRIAAIQAAVGAVDIVVLLIGWNDAYQSTTSAATKYSDLLLTIRAGAWASAKIVMCTLSPEPNKTTAQTGNDYPVYHQINAQVRAEADANHILADIAALTDSGAADRSAMVEKLLYDARYGPDAAALTRQGGLGMPSRFGGHQITSWQSIQDYNAQWRQTAWRIGGNGGTNGLAASPSVIGHPYFVNNVSSIVPWLWVFAGQGHNSTNTVVEARNLFAQAWRGSTGQWEFFFQGARPGASGNSSAVWDEGSSQVLRGYRSDGITTYYRTGGNTNIENWAADTVPSRGVVEFTGGSNRALMTDAVCFCVGVQVRLALLDPAGTNDIAQSRFIVGCGFDAFAGAATRYDYWGWPLEAMDGGHDRWQVLQSTEWTVVGSISIGRTSPSYDGPNDSEHFEDPGTAPPHAENWSPATPFNNIGAYSKTQSQVRSNPPRLPQYWSTSGAAGVGWVPTDYWINTTTGVRDIHWSQQGADKAARVIYDAMVGAGLLTGFTGSGPISPSLLPGIATVARWWTRFTVEDPDPGESTADWELAQVAQNSPPEFPSPGLPPTWPVPYGLPQAVSGLAYTASVTANGTPTPTYTHVSGKPAWMTIASDGSITGTPTETAETDYSIVIEASNSEGDVEGTFALNVAVHPAITTVTLDDGVVGLPYRTTLEAVGEPPLSWSLASPGLPAGLSLTASGVIVGTPTTAGSGTFDVLITDARGLTDVQEMTITIGGEEWTRLPRNAEVWVRIPRAT